MARFRTKTYGKKQNSKVKTVAITLAVILGLGAVGGGLYHIVNTRYNPITLDHGVKHVVGFTGMTNANGVLTYTGDFAKFNEITEEVEDEETGETETVVSDSPLYKLKTTGEFVEMSSPLDDQWPYNQIKTVKDKNNNSFTQFPVMYMSYTYNRAGYLDGVSFANYKVDDSYFINDAYLKQDGSGAYSDYFYIGQYEASGTADKIYSVPSAKPLANLTRDQFRQASRKYGSAKNYYNGYQQMDISMWDMYALLVSMYLKTDDVQSVYEGPTNVSATVTTGSTAPIALMNGWNTTTKSVKFLGVENAYGSASEWCDGLNFDDTAIYYQSNPNNFSDTVDKTSDVIVEFQRPTTSGFVELLKTGTSSKTQSVIYPAFSVTAPAEGEQAGYEGDGYWYNTGARVLNVGGHCGYGAKAGLWYFDGSNDASYANGGVGGRLCGRSLSGVQ